MSARPKHSSAPAATAGREVWKTIELPSGRTAVIYRSKTKDVVRASRMVGFGNEADMLFMCAKIACNVEFDGKYLTLEEIEELDEPDFWELLKEVNLDSGGKHLQPPTSPS